MFGLELFWALIQKDLKSKNDGVIAAIHFCLLKNGYRNVGVGESFLLTDENSRGSERLPADWNKDQTGYVLRYVHSSHDVKRRLVLKAVELPTGGSVLCSFLENPGEKTAEMTIKPDQILTDKYKEYSGAFVNGSETISTLNDQFKREVTQKLSPEKSGPSDQNSRSTSPGRHHPSPNPNGPRPNNPRSDDWDQDVRHPQRYPPRVGGADLDPLSGGRGGGMLMDPRDLFGPNRPRLDPNAGLPPGAPRLPPGAVPPGARFDPFGPPGVGPRGPRGPRPPGSGFSGPNPDHMRRPDDYDDMFM